MSQDALFQLGMGLDAPKTAQKEDLKTKAARKNERPGPKKNGAQGSTEAVHDFFIEKNGVRCAGSHFIIDIYGGKRLDDLEHVERTLIDCVNAAGATLLHVHLHPFEPNGGISGVAVLAESHISIHSWPERDYAALDIFMCGRTKPERCLDVLKKAFAAERMVVRELLRGKDLC
ncbi:MAG: adenosylmethionine decarboxylase [Gammaproteobacteria bacterium]|nr:adenosylmethionine decarboxylase [Gammaproteobacteria bacterium]